MQMQQSTRNLINIFDFLLVCVLYITCFVGSFIFRTSLFQINLILFMLPIVCLLQILYNFKQTLHLLAKISRSMLVYLSQFNMQFKYFHSLQQKGYVIFFITFFSTCQEQKRTEFISNKVHHFKSHDIYIHIATNIYN